jgi:hypothetical protein
MPSDAHRIGTIMQLIEEERRDRVLDTHTNYQLVSGVCMVAEIVKEKWS